MAGETRKAVIGRRGAQGATVTHADVRLGRVLVGVGPRGWFRAREAAPLPGVTYYIGCGARWWVYATFPAGPPLEQAHGLPVPR